MMIDLGSIDADVSVTLWYNSSSPNYNTHPVIAEISFKYKDNSSQFSKKVVNRAKTSFDTLQHMVNWVDANSTIKTRFVYQANPSFCY